MAESPSKREQLREERRQQILAAALAVFSEKGYHTTNVSDVAARAGVSQGTIYWYFDSKEELFTAALLSFFEKVAQATAADLDRCPTAADQIRALARGMVGFAHEAGSVLMRYLEFWASTSRREEGEQLWSEMLNRYNRLMADIIEEGVQHGEFRPVDAEALIWAFMATYDGLAAYVMLTPDLDVNRVSEVFVETLLRGLQI